MQIGTELRRLVTEVEDEAFEACREPYRLTVLKIADESGQVGFTVWEARSRGWSPVLAGRVNDNDEMTVTFSSLPTSPKSGLDLLRTFVANELAGKTATPLLLARTVHPAVATPN
jgi:hypothetical protein